MNSALSQKKKKKNGVLPLRLTWGIDIETVDMVFLDFGKAFNSANHRVITATLKPTIP